METTIDKKLRLLELKKQIDESSAILKSMGKDLYNLNKEFKDALNETEKIFEDYDKNQFTKSKPYKILLIKEIISIILASLLMISSLVASLIRMDWYVLIPLVLSVMLLLYCIHLSNITLAGIKGDLDYINGDMEDSILIMDEASKEYETRYENYEVQFKVYQRLLKEYQDLYKEIGRK